MPYGFNDDKSRFGFDLSDVVRTADIADVVRTGEISQTSSYIDVTISGTTDFYLDECMMIMQSPNIALVRLQIVPNKNIAAGTSYIDKKITLPNGLRFCYPNNSEYVYQNLYNQQRNGAIENAYICSNSTQDTLNFTVKSGTTLSEDSTYDLWGLVMLKAK